MNYPNKSYKASNKLKAKETKEHKIRIRDNQKKKGFKDSVRLRKIYQMLFQFSMLNKLQVTMKSQCNSLILL